MIERAKHNTHAQRTMTPGRRQKSKDVKYNALTDKGVTVPARTHRAGRAAERSASVQLNQTQRVKHNQTRAMRAKHDVRRAIYAERTPRTATTYARNELDARKALTIR